MSTLFKIILANVFVSLFSLVGIIFVSVKEKLLDKILLWLVSFASGALIGVAFLHMIPRSIENNSKAIYFVVLGIVVFFLLEKFFYWRHCHEQKCEVHSFAYLNLIGDSFHNFIDGMVIAGSFVTDVNLGIITTLAVIVHEIPQELGDFGVLVHGGFNKKKALTLNFLTALFAVAGGIVGFIFTEKISFIRLNLVPFTAGGFIYVSLVDLVPELHRRFSLKESFVQLLLVISGISIFALL
ncbi:ZIP family metal transporter [Candidatus Chrysopegis kryptomonas]|uniref:Zinc and cadmium transporter n=1 Tax=Candidatus Chryseopegocella kryptomonas TaxID=1633643 RepID=A0A0P1NV44_9BACT|nr:ZIP family metal transporter [Candidatus Chrysopegis kryptomonas]CUT02765.1 zinc and cadmium transporter [Candidatus Chrysopegis kryptomonas]